MKNIIFLLATAAFMIGGFSAIGQSPQSDFTISADRTNEISFLLEEEKLARDFYLEMTAEYDARVFKNISQSEQQHLEMMIDLAKKYGVEIPASISDDKRGVFANAKIQKMYDELMAEGEKSLTDALKAGAKIEETDIADLEKVIAANPDSEESELYGKLLSASHNHLRAFVKNLEKQGVDYTPVLLGQSEFNDIQIATKSCGKGKSGKGAGGCCSAKKGGKGAASCGGGKKKGGGGCCSKTK